MNCDNSVDYFELLINLGPTPSNCQMASLRPVHDKALAANEVLKAENYGSMTLPNCREPPRTLIENSTRYMALYINKALVEDVERSLFGSSANNAFMEIEKCMPTFCYFTYLTP